MDWLTLILVIIIGFIVLAVFRTAIEAYQSRKYYKELDEDLKDDNC